LYRLHTFLSPPTDLVDLSEGDESDEEEREEEKRREEEERNLAAAQQLRISQLLEVPPGIDLFSRRDGSVGFKYFTFQDLSLENDFKYAR
jgi:hypothetical protein